MPFSQFGPAVWLTYMSEELYYIDEKTEIGKIANAWDKFLKDYFLLGNFQEPRKTLDYFMKYREKCTEKSEIILWNIEKCTEKS